MHAAILHPLFNILFLFPILKISSTSNSSLINELMDLVLYDGEQHGAVYEQDQKYT